MNGIDFVADSNCFVYLLDEHPIMLSFLDSIWAFSYITEMEVLSKKNITHDEDKLLRNMFGNCMKIAHQQEITELTIKLRRKYSIKLPDAIIAATSLYTKLPLLTADRGFSLIKEINCCILTI